jgi:hypothetical protein
MALLVVQAGAEPADASVAPAEAPVAVLGEVVDAKGRPVSELVVFAVERGSSRIVAAARPDPDGLFKMKVSSRLHDFGILSSRWQLGGFQPTSPTTIKVVAYPAFPDTDPVEVVKRAKAWAKVAAPPLETAGASASVGFSGSIGQVTGVVTDETGAPLQGVRLLAMQASSERLISVAQTDRQGKYTLVTLAGANRVYAYAPGLTLKEARVKTAGHLDVVLTIDTQIESLTLRTGRMISFKMSDSIYPEMLPPSKVATALSYDYGISLADGCFCPGDLLNQPPPTPAEQENACLWSGRQSRCASAKKCPATVWARSCMLPHNWWLRLIQMSPPNPTRLGQGEISDPKPRMWWYDAIKAMQEEDARARAKGQ